MARVEDTKLTRLNPEIYATGFTMLQDLVSSPILPPDHKKKHHNFFEARKEGMTNVGREKWQENTMLRNYYNYYYLQADYKKGEKKNILK